MKDIERFLAKVRKTDSCWLWKGKKLSKPPNNYGRFTLDGGWVLAHRASWTLFVGAIPDGLKVLHHCDNPLCVRPEHLFVGTQIDNIRDMCAKGRQSSCRGENHPNARFTKDQVQTIRHLCASEKKIYGKYASIARSYGVTPAAIRAIATGMSWNT